MALRITNSYSSVYTKIAFASDGAMEDDDKSMANGPLSGIRVLEVAGLGPGPFCSMLLADLGADVVRVDRPRGQFGIVEPEIDLLNRGKRSIVIDMKTSSGVETTLALAERAQIMLEGFRPGVSERLGIGPEICLQRNPKLVYGRVTGWGQDGPLAHTAGHDLNYIALTGALHAFGPEGGPPQIPLALIGDFPTGLYLAVGLLSALHEACSNGRGQVVDAAVVDSTAHMMSMFYGLLAADRWRDERGVNLIDGGAPFYGVHLTADGKYMAVGSIEPQFFDEMTTLLGLDVNVDHFDPTTWPRLRKQISDAFRTRTQEEWTSIFAGSDACVAPVMSMSDAPKHPHVKARNTFVNFDEVNQPAPTPRFSRSSLFLYRGPCIPGEHTEEVINDWLKP